MELLYPNLINTTTQISVASNSDLIRNLFDPDVFNQYFTDGYANDNTTASITIAFSATTTIDRIALKEMNLVSFNIYYNGATANALSLTGSNPTGTANFVSNTASDLYLQLATPINCTSLTIDMRKTITANSEKAIGLLLLSQVQLDFPRIPNASSYQPSLEPKQIVHTMSDGGTKVHTVREKWKLKIKFAHIESSFRDDLREIWEAHDAVVVVPFGTGTSWDGVLFEGVWVGPFNFYKYSDNAASAGFSGDIDFRETAG